jgi:hypothetical protein
MMDDTCRPAGHPACVGAGEQARLLSRVLMKLKLADQVTAPLPLTPSGTAGTCCSRPRLSWPRRGSSSSCSAAPAPLSARCHGVTYPLVTRILSGTLPFPGAPLSWPDVVPGWSEGIPGTSSLALRTARRGRVSCAIARSASAVEARDRATSYRHIDRAPAPPSSRANRGCERTLLRSVSRRRNRLGQVPRAGRHGDHRPRVRGYAGPARRRAGGAAR